MYQMHRYSEGIRAAYKALELAQKATEEQVIIHVPLDECYYNVGMGYLLLKEYEQAYELLDQALIINPQNTMALQYMEWLKNHKNNSRLHQQETPENLLQSVNIG